MSVATTASQAAIADFHRRESAAKTWLKKFSDDLLEKALLRLKA